MTDAYHALAEPHRRSILDLLRAGERPVGELVAALPLSQPSVSRHLKILQGAGLVAVRGDAQRRLYRVEPRAFAEVERWIQSFRAEWADRLDDLEQHLDQMEDP